MIRADLKIKKVVTLNESDLEAIYTANNLDFIKKFLLRYEKLEYTTLQHMNLLNDILVECYKVGITRLEIKFDTTLLTEGNQFLFYTSKKVGSHFSYSNIMIDQDCDISYMYFDLFNRQLSHRELFLYDEGLNINYIALLLK